jgi:hypothetical protein
MNPFSRLSLSHDDLYKTCDRGGVYCVYYINCFYRILSEIDLFCFILFFYSKSPRKYWFTPLSLECAVCCVYREISTCNTVASAERDRVDRAGTRKKQKRSTESKLFWRRKKEEDEKVGRVLWRGEAHSCAAAACWPPQGSFLIERFVRIYTHHFSRFSFSNLSS